MNVVRIRSWDSSYHFPMNPMYGYSNNFIYLCIYVKGFHFSPKTNECNNNGRNKAKPLESKVNHKRGN